MQSAGVWHVTRREILIEYYIGDQPSAPVDSLEEIMAEQRVVRHPTRKAAPEGRHVIYALASVDPLTEEVLIHI
jgi:hypothetical protein